ncbi:MAG: metallopeptidase family protein [Vicinamibacteria bacterium]
MTPDDEVLVRVSRLLDRARLREARRVADAALYHAPDSADGHYALGLVLTHCARVEEADAAFARAAALGPTEYFLPYRVEREEFERLVEDALASLPSEFQRHLENVEVAVEDVPSPSLLREDLGHDTLGLYQGDSIQSSDWGFPDRILLFRRNLENISPDRKTLLKEIRTTVLHEVGHHLGMEEDHLEQIERDDGGWDE